MLTHVLTSPSLAAPGGRWLDYVAECEQCGWLSDRHEERQFVETACPQCAMLQQTAQRRASLKLLIALHQPVLEVLDTGAEIERFEQWASSTNYCGYNREA